MTARTVEIRREPTHLAGERSGRELAAREADGLHVQLVWDAIADAVTVEVEDRRAGTEFQIVVDRGRALDAYYHPFAYAA